MHILKLCYAFFILLITILIFVPSINAQDIDAGVNFGAQLPIRIKNNSGTPMTNSSVRLVVNTQALITFGIMQADCDDMRFGPNCGLSPSPQYPYWLEGPVNSASTVVWVLVPSVPANDSVLIYMYCGVPSMSGNSQLSLVFNGPHSSTDSVASGGAGAGVANCQRGFRFTPITNILVTHFGKREPLGSTRYVTLFDFNSQAILRQRQVSGPAAQYSYDTLGAPIMLNPGQQYLIEMFGDGSSYGYYFGLSTQIGQHLTYGDMRYCNSCTQNTFPTTILAGYHYGYPDFWYFVPNNPVTPGPTHINGTPADTNTPAAPTGLTGIPGNQQIALRWNKSPAFDAAKYLIYRNTTNNPNTATLVDSTIHPDTLYTNTGLINGTNYFFWVRVKDGFCSPRISNYSIVFSATPTSIENISSEIPKVYALYQNYPNPFNPVTNINFDIPKASLVRITVYDLLGKEVGVILNQDLTAGRYKTDWDASTYASGVYFYKVEAGDFVDRKKMVVVK